MSAHTPGPWIDQGCRRTLHGERRDIDIGPASGRRVATVSTGVDAALVAAAPELLAALRGLVGLERRNLLKDRAAKAWIGAAEAAIAKAEGRS